MSDQKTMQVTLNKEEALLLWRLTYNARGKSLDEYGTTYISDSLEKLMNKLIFPDSSK